MHLVLHDYANYAFTRQLATSLSAQGISVTYAFNADYDGPNSKTQLPRDSRVTFLPISGFGAEGARSSFSKRLKAELAYSRKLLASIKDLKADFLLSANSPSIVQHRLAKHAHARKMPFGTWLQDLYGVAARRILGRKLPVLGQIIGQYFISLDKHSLRMSDQVVLITEDFRPFALSAGVAQERLHIIENWAPVAEIPVLPKMNEWSQSVSLPDVFRYVYSGTLAMKHNPALLLELAKRLAIASNSSKQSPAEVMVVSSSPGALWLEEQAKKLSLTNLRRLDFQPSSAFPSILGSADVLVAILEATASTFSVPSKVLSYLCAGKPILAAIPTENLAARIVRKADAGVVVDPSLVEDFAGHGLSFASMPLDQRNQLGFNARKYAEHAFDLNRITSAFKSVLGASRQP